jgi:hypothetical protein
MTATTRVVDEHIEILMRELVEVKQKKAEKLCSCSSSLAGKEECHDEMIFYAILLVTLLCPAV